MRNKSLNFILSILLIISNQFTLAIDNFTPTPSNTNGRLQNGYMSFSNNNYITASNIATLSDLKVGNNTLDGFSPSVYNYEKINSYCEVSDNHVSATATHANATVEITQLSAQNPNIATVLVTAEDGISQLTYTISFSETNEIVIESVTPIDAPCPGEYGGFTITATGGYGNLEYGLFLKENDEYIWHWWYSHTNAPNNVGKADYVIKVRDQYGCEETWNNGQTETFSEPELIVTADKTNVTNNGAANGTIAVNVNTEGAESIEYYLSIYNEDEDDYATYRDDQLSNVFENLPPGLYIATALVEYSECGGYADTEPIEITEPSSGTPEELSIEDETFDGTSSECFGAVQNITVAENGNQVLFQNTSNVNLIAGQSIRFLPGTVIEPRAYVHAWITTNNSFCDALLEAIVAANNATEKSVEFAAITTDGQFREATLKVFPNPSNGRFTIQTYGFGTQSNVVIYNSLGALVFNTQICGTKTLELYNLQKGIYIVKTTNNETTRAQRITIQ
jgi:hypothetical protein